MWQVKHLNGLTLVSGRCGQFRSINKTSMSGLGLRVRMCLSRCSSRVKDCPQYVQKTILRGVAPWRQWVKSEGVSTFRRSDGDTQNEGMEKRTDIC